MLITTNELFGKKTHTCGYCGQTIKLDFNVIAGYPAQRGHLAKCKDLQINTKDRMRVMQKIRQNKRG
jgi:hypothetical protein